MTLVRGYRGQLSDRRCEATLDPALMGRGLDCARAIGHRGPHTLTYAWGDSDVVPGTHPHDAACSCDRMPGVGHVRSDCYNLGGGA